MAAVDCPRPTHGIARRDGNGYGSGMVKRQDIKAFVAQVAAQFHPRRVILFGSYAYGKPTADSDVDLLIVMPHEGPPSLKAAEIRKQVRSGFPMDLVVRSPKEIQRRLTMGDFFIREIMERGKPLYEAQMASQPPATWRERR